MIVHAGITDQIIAYMKEKIDSGAWSVGEKIPSENQLSRELGVSRASVRDAIKYYTGLGRMRTLHGKGTYLTEPVFLSKEAEENIITAADCENIRDVLEFRRTIESEACARAAENIDDETLAILEFCQQEMKNNEEDKDHYLKADIEFHRLIASSSGNLLYQKSLYQVLDESRETIWQMFDVFGSKNGIEQHQIVLDALKKKDPKAARKAMVSHMQNSLDKLKVLKEFE